MAKHTATTAKRARGAVATRKNIKGKPKARAPKEVISNKRQASEEDNTTSDEEILVARRRKKSRRALEADEVDDEFDEPEIEVVDDNDDGPSEKDSNEVL